MAKILWACWDGGGNLPPSLGIADALRASGHHVVFAGRAEMIGRVRAAGFEQRELTQAYTLLDRYGPHPQQRIFAYLSSPAVGRELLGVVAEEAPDLVAIDAMFGAALHVAPQFGAPSAVVVHTFLRRMLGAWQANLRMQSEYRQAAGFAPLPDLDALWGARDLVQVNTLDDFDGTAANPWSNVRHGAPVLDEERRAFTPDLPWPAEDARPLVLLSFSTVLEQRSPLMLQRALDALAELPVHVAATTGAIVDPAELTVPANAAIFRFASHEALMKRAALVLTHGGHGTAMRALRHGLPMVLTPAGAGDQPFVGAAVQEWGAGRALPRDAPATALRDAVRSVLDNNACRERAACLARRLRGQDGARSAAQALAGLAN